MHMENYNNAHGKLQQCTWKITTMHMENYNNAHGKSTEITHNTVQTNLNTTKTNLPIMQSEVLGQCCELELVSDVSGMVLSFSA